VEAASRRQGDVMTAHQSRLLQAARRASRRLPGQYRRMIDGLMMLTGPDRSGKRPVLRLIGR